ncbi:MAG: hypothetical protein E7167_03560 [Firmicutes bacterium]|nr:hypothetical protein [Bacillota bacterium]
MEMDMKLALATVEQIISENTLNKEVLDACEIAITEIKESIKAHYLDKENHSPMMDVTELFGLYRTRVMLMLLRDVNRFGDQKPEIDSSFALLLKIVEEKINKLQERKEENKNEKDIRR